MPRLFLSSDCRRLYCCLFPCDSSLAWVAQRVILNVLVRMVASIDTLLSHDIRSLTTCVLTRSSSAHWRWSAPLRLAGESSLPRTWLTKSAKIPSSRICWADSENKLCCAIFSCCRRIQCSSVSEFLSRSVPTRTCTRETSPCRRAVSSSLWA
jgi:hypothetical protein